MLLEKKCKELGIERKVHIMQTYDHEPNITDVPSAIGLFRPMVYFPTQTVKTGKIKDIEPILLHELLHIKRNDYLINWIQMVIQAIFFFHPFVWYVNWRIRELREEVCDDIVIKFIKNRKKYAKCLVGILDRITRENAFVFLGSNIIERKSSLARRIVRIADRQYRYFKPITIPSFIGIIVITALSFSLSCDSEYNIIGELNKSANNNLEKIPQYDNPSYMVLKIVESGIYEIEGESVSKSNLKSILKTTMEKNNKTNIQIIRNQEISFDEIVYIMDIAYSIGFKYVAIEK